MNDLTSAVGIAGMRGDIRSEWDETKQHDVLFLLTIRPPDQAELALMQQDGAEPHPAEKFGLAYVRGCEVMEVKDEGTALTIIVCAAVNACMSMDDLLYGISWLCLAVATMTKG